MTRKTVLYALAVVVLTGCMAVAALAGDYGMSLSEPAESSVSAQPEQSVELQDAGEIREPVETGSVPERSDSSPDSGSGAAGDEATVEIGGRMHRPSVDLTP